MNQPRSLSLRLDLLDRQVVDSEGRPVGRLDDIEVDVPSPQAAAVTEFALGAATLGPRVGGWLGARMVDVAERLATDEASPVLPVSEVTEWAPLIRLRRPLRSLPGVAGLERWLGVHVVSRLPGGGHADV